MANLSGNMTDDAAGENAAANPLETEGPLPDFVAGVMYDVRLSRQVEYPPGTGNFLRPGAVTHIDGAVCESIRDAIDGAVRIVEPSPA